MISLIALPFKRKVYEKSSSSSFAQPTIPKPYGLLKIPPTHFGIFMFCSKAQFPNPFRPNILYKSLIFPFAMQRFKNEVNPNLLTIQHQEQRNYSLLYPSHSISLSDLHKFPNSFLNPRALLDERKMNNTLVVLIFCQKMTKNSL